MRLLVLVSKSLPLSFFVNSVHPRVLFAVMEALEVVVPAGRALSWHGAVRHTIAEIHPHVVASALLPRHAESRRHSHKTLGNVTNKERERQAFGDKNNKPHDSSAHH